ncbi:type IV toxin-antitoxin system AbiEi family antitoxin [Mycolicibacter heraklionensis]|uniref:type IV toxin-antitoxin system AbiEi family antitoxin n=1 Tax=Mycolicibacter heraklionensis TaxID=512402 RepID=UPI0009E62FF4|nr:type IV toxin-antitoxin system AbiEi family antitoxin [Mycolicibacter heraklionensis]
MTAARRISRSVAPVVEQLELDGDLLVPLDRLAAIMRQVGLEADQTAARHLAYELQREGWLGPLRTRHVWEFLPGARGGAYGSGDRFIELRAQLAVNPSWPGVLAMDSAASILGLAQRIPEQEVVALPVDTSFPKALTGDWRYVRIELSKPGLTTINGLPSWNIEGLLVGIAARPSAYKDVAGLGQWLTESVVDVDKDTVISLLKPMHRTTAQRAAYLLGAAGNDYLRAAILATYPARGTAWLGPRIAGQGVFDALTQVNDTLLHPYLNVGGGS